MYIATVPNRNSPPAILLREGWREGNKTRQRTVANLSDWPKEKIETFRRLLRDERLVSPEDLFATQKTLPHGHVQVVLEMIARLELDRLISAKCCRERDLVVAMIVQRLIDPCSKLATTREWHSTTLAEELHSCESVRRGPTILRMNGRKNIRSKGEANVRISRDANARKIRRPKT
jgi:hypothetical protein